MKKLMLTMLSVVGMMLFVALPAKACTSYYVGKDCTKDGTRALCGSRSPRRCKPRRLWQYGRTVA